jgi:hypothetical protein
MKRQVGVRETLCDSIGRQHFSNVAEMRTDVKKNAHVVCDVQF